MILDGRENRDAPGVTVVVDEAVRKTTRTVGNFVACARLLLRLCCGLSVVLPAPARDPTYTVNNNLCEK